MSSDVEIPEGSANEGHLDFGRRPKFILSACKAVEGLDANGVETIG